MDELLSRLTALHSAVISDAMDELGVRDHTMVPVLHNYGTPAQIAGRAATLEVVAVDEIPDEPYEVQFRAVDALSPGEVMVVAASAAPSAFWGELITTRAVVKGATGAIIDGYCRDVGRIRAQEFALWARGTHPADSAGRLDAVSFGGPISCAGVRVEPGDYLLGDLDGIAVVPAALIRRVLDVAEAKARIEDAVRTELASGATIADTYTRYGVM